MEFSFYIVGPFVLVIGTVLAVFISRIKNYEKQKTWDICEYNFNKLNSSLQAETAKKNQM